MASGKHRGIEPSRSPEAKGEEVPVCEENDENAAGEGDEK